MTASTTILTAEQVEAIAAKYGIEPWTKKGDDRYYLNLDALADIIGLKQEFYRSGNVSDCSYVGLDGEEVTVANSRAYGKGYSSCKTYISGGIVHTNWESGYDDIAELIALRIVEMLGGDPDEGEVDEKWAVLPEVRGYMDYYFETESEAEAKLAEVSDKFPDRVYHVHQVKIGKRTNRVTIVK